MEVHKNTFIPSMKKREIHFDEKKETPLFNGKIKDIEFTFIQKRIVILMKRGFSDEQIRGVLLIEKKSYNRCVADVKEVFNLLNCFSLRTFIQML